MSRHRFVKNLTEDDMYDDYYNDDDDYYYEEDDAYYEEAEQYSYSSSKQQQQQQQQQPPIKKQTAAVSSSLSSSTSKSTTSFANTSRTAGHSSSSSSPSTLTSSNSKLSSIKSKENDDEEEQQLRLITGMGFRLDQAKVALQQSGHDPQVAINLLLTGKISVSSTSSTSSTTTKGKSTIRMGGGISKAPPGFGGPPPPPPPPAPSAISNKASGIQKPPPGFLRPPSSSTTNTESTTTTKKKQKKKDVSSSTSPSTASSGNKGNKSTTTTNTATTTAAPPPLSISDAVKERLFQHRKSRLSMVVLGHVDAGKSTLMGQLLVQLGIVSARQVSKHQQEASTIGKASFALAWVMDEDASERERGVTMDVATKAFATARHEVTILDAPGHADFVPSMITGAAAANVGLLVLDATDYRTGIERGQTKEHVILARGLGVQQLIVVMNKMDIVHWSAERVQEIQTRLKPFLKQNGFLPKRTPFIPVSGLEGINMTHQTNLPSELSSWYGKDGMTLLQAIDRFEPALNRQELDKAMRGILTDVYTEGKHVIVKCRVVQGTCQVGDTLVVLPNGDMAQLTRLERQHHQHGTVVVGADDNAGKKKDVSSQEADAVHYEDDQRYAMAGDLVAMTLSGVEVIRLSPGHIVAPAAVRPTLSRKVEAKVIIMDDLAVPIIRGAQMLLHMHSMDVPVIVSKLVSIVKTGGKTITKNKNDGGNNNNSNNRLENPRVLTSGVHATVQLLLKSAVVLEPFTECRALGRFVLRRGGDTVAVGIVETLIG